MFIYSSFRSKYFTGKVNIQLTITESVPCIFIHYHQIIFNQILLISEDNLDKWEGQISPAKEYKEDTGKLTFTIPSIKPGEYTLTIEYQGCVSEYIKGGFYSCIDRRFECITKYKR